MDDNAPVIKKVTFDLGRTIRDGLDRGSVCLCNSWGLQPMYTIFYHLFFFLLKIILKASKRPCCTRVSCRELTGIYMSMEIL